MNSYKNKITGQIADYDKVMGLWYIRADIESQPINRYQLDESSDWDELASPNYPILRTKDGHNLYHGDHAYQVTENFEISKWLIWDYCWKNQDEKKKRLIFFKDEDKANEYINEHNKKYSKFDILSTLKVFNLDSYAEKVIKYMEDQKNG